MIQLPRDFIITVVGAVTVWAAIWLFAWLIAAALAGEPPRGDQQKVFEQQRRTNELLLRQDRDLRNLQWDMREIKQRRQIERMLATPDPAR
jgi:hypothetical protein